MTTRTSARNHLPGIVENVKLGTVMAQIDIRVGEHRVVAVITRESAEELRLRKGDSVLAAVKSTDIMVERADGEDIGYAG